MDRKFLAALFGLALFGAVGTASAAVIISPTGATATSEFSSSFDIGNTIDQSGLFTGFTDGVTDFDVYLASNPLNSLSSLNDDWFSAAGDTAPTVVYDLGSAMTIDRFALWNEESAGIGVFDLSVSLDNVAFTSVLTGVTPFDNPGGSDYPAEVFALGNQFARFIKLDISGCPQPLGVGGDSCGIGEVAFSRREVAEPATLTLFGLGLLGLGAARRRHRSK